MKRIGKDSGITKWGFMFNEAAQTVKIPMTLAINWSHFYFYLGLWIPYTRIRFNIYALKKSGLFINFHKIFSFKNG
jgi:hypothetical protein